jgi:thiol-disulfide isomerase/thioredoxin
VPEFPAAADWYNCAPLKLSRELSGRVVVLDFWTFCCVNCMHVLPELVSLERKYAAEPVTVVGVHSAKFDNEKDEGAVRSAVLRCDPVDATATFSCIHEANMWSPDTYLLQIQH